MYFQSLTQRETGQDVKHGLEAPVYPGCRYNQVMERRATAHVERAFRDIENVLGPVWAGRVVKEFAQQLPLPPAPPRFKNAKKRTVAIEEYEQLWLRNPRITHEEAAEVIHAKYPFFASVPAIKKLLQRCKVKERKSIGRRLLEAVGGYDGHWIFRDPP